MERRIAVRPLLVRSIIIRRPAFRRMSQSCGAGAVELLSAAERTSIGTLDNYQTNTTASTHSDQISARYNRSFGAAPARGGRGGGGGGGGRGQGQQNRNAPPVLRQSIAENFAYSHSASSSQAFSPLLGGNSESNGYSLTSSYTVGYGRLNSTATLGWNRSLSTGNNYFTNTAVNPAQQAGVNVGTPAIYNNPFYFGVPSVALTGFQGLSDFTPSNRVNQTITFSDFVAYRFKKHNVRVGYDFHRIHADVIGGSECPGLVPVFGFCDTESGSAAMRVEPRSDRIPTASSRLPGRRLRTCCLVCHSSRR